MTELQLRAFDFVRDHITISGVAPTMAEVAKEIGVNPSRARELVDGLVRRGRLIKERGKARGLSLPQAPDLKLVGTDELKSELARRGALLDALPRSQPLYSRNGRSCAADSCHMQVRRGHLFCRDHWFSLPLTLREGILQAHRRRDAGQYQELVTKARDRIDCGIVA